MTFPGDNAGDNPMDEEVDWDAVDAEYEAFLQEAYGGKLPTLHELKRDVRLLRQERQQRPECN